MKILKINLIPALGLSSIYLIDIKDHKHRGHCNNQDEKQQAFIKHNYYIMRQKVANILKFCQFKKHSTGGVNHLRERHLLIKNHA